MTAPRAAPPGGEGGRATSSRTRGNPLFVSYPAGEDTGSARPDTLGGD